MKKPILLLANLLLVGLCMYAQSPQGVVEKPVEKQQVATPSDVVFPSPTRLAGTEPPPTPQKPTLQLNAAEAAARAYLTSDAYAQAIEERIKMFRQKGDQKSVEKLEGELNRVKALKEL